MSDSSPEPEDPVEVEGDVPEEVDEGQVYVDHFADDVLMHHATNGEFRLSLQRYRSCIPSTAPPTRVSNDRPVGVSNTTLGTSVNQGRVVRLPNGTYQFIVDDTVLTNPTNPSSNSGPSAPSHITAFTTPDAPAPPGGASLAIPLDEGVQSASGSLVGDSRQLLDRLPTDKRPLTATSSGGSDTGESAAGPSSPKRPRTHDEEPETPAPASATTAEPSSARGENAESTFDPDATGLPFVSFSMMPSPPAHVDPDTEDWRANWTAGASDTGGLAVPTRVTSGDDVPSSLSEHSSLLNLSLDSSPRAPESPKDDAGQAF